MNTGTSSGNRRVITDTNTNGVTLTYVEKECEQCQETFQTALQYDRCPDCRTLTVTVSVSAGPPDLPLMEHGPHSERWRP